MDLTLPMGRRSGTGAAEAVISLTVDKGLGMAKIDPSEQSAMIWWSHESMSMTLKENINSSSFTAITTMTATVCDEILMNPCANDISVRNNPERMCL